MVFDKKIIFINYFCMLLIFTYISNLSCSKKKQRKELKSKKSKQNLTKYTKNFKKNLISNQCKKTKGYKKESLEEINNLYFKVFIPFDEQIKAFNKTNEYILLKNIFAFIKKFPDVQNFLEKEQTSEENLNQMLKNLLLSIKVNNNMNYDILVFKFYKIYLNRNGFCQNEYGICFSKNFFCFIKFLNAKFLEKSDSLTLLQDFFYLTGAFITHYRCDYIKPFYDISTDVHYEFNFSEIGIFTEPPPYFRWQKQRERNLWVDKIEFEVKDYPNILICRTWFSVENFIKKYIIKKQCSLKIEFYNVEYQIIGFYIEEYDSQAYLWSEDLLYFFTEDNNTSSKILNNYQQISSRNITLILKKE